MSVRSGQIAKVVARSWLNPEKDSDGVTCAESAEGWETNSVCLLSSGKFLLQLQEKTQRQSEQSDQVPDTKYAKNAKPTPEVRPYLSASVMES